MYRPGRINLFVLSMTMIAAIAFIDPATSYGRFQDNKTTRPRPTAPPGQFPVTGNPRTTTTAKPINSKLLVFTVNGGGTTVTKTNGEFGSTLAASATVGKEFAVQWTRTKPGNAEKGTLYVTSPNSTSRVGVQNVSMPAQSTSVDIQYSMPNLPPNTYEMVVASETGYSTKVTINYTGKGSDTHLAITPGQTVSQLASSKGKVTSAKFTPVVGSLNEPGYKNAKLVLTLEAETDWQINGIAVEVYSEPFINSEIITASGTKNKPIKLFSGTWKVPAGTTIHPGTPKVITIPLYRTSKDEVNAQEAGPGIYGPADWKIAFAQTTTASFSWTVDGNASGSAQQSPKKQWQSP